MPCPGVSPAARQFISESGIATWETVDLSPEGVAALRLENSQAAALGCQAVQEETGAIVEDAEIGGVSVQWVSPQLIIMAQ